MICLFDTMENLTILQDTREQENKQDHVLQYFEENGIKVIRSKLFVGDYSLIDNMRISVDRKKDVLEIANCICSKEHIRFRNELIRAYENGIKLFILIEDENIKSLEELKYYKVPTFKSTQYKNGQVTHRKGEKRSSVNLEALSKAMITMEQKYGCKFVFSTHKNFGATIVKILTNKAI